ncbi:hypothetical protein PSHT_09059 [Puccinia striiformis]|uniref:Uncharacterized protein n=1 Tax=Puccinia striiformis TaxID=27350 RepID=A0A2S4VJ91_9BASI|nr:hypothetical protein PSHT_09059 [Puccinia striiformis]
MALHHVPPSFPSRPRGNLWRTMSHLYQTQRPQLRPSGRIRLEDGSLKTTSPVNRINGDAVTAVLQGVEKCDGAPVIATIGESNQPISVLLDYAAGEKC